MNQELNKSQEAQQHEKRVVNEQLLTEIFNAATGKYEDVLKIGDPTNLEISKLNGEAKKFAEEMAAAVGDLLDDNTRKLQAAVERLKQKVSEREAATEAEAATKRKTEAMRLGGQAAADYYLDQQRQKETKGEGNLQERMAARRKKFGPKPPESQA